MKRTFKILSLLTMVLIMLAPAASARAGLAEVDLLSSYIDQWRGEGTLVGGDEPEPFRCRLTVAKGNQGRVNYTGRCSLVDTTLSISGTIAYSDENNRYEAVMSSNAGFTGAAIGIKRGERISFDLRESQRDRSGSNVRIGARILLVDGTIKVDFEVEFNDSGSVLTASVPFSR